jgi:hypothetical protein
MHFEFNGTVDEARAILLHNYGRGACFDVADTSGAVTNQCLLRNEVPAAGLRSVIDTAAPAGTAAALVEISLTGATTTGYVTAESCGPAPTTGRIATANVRLNRTVTALTVVNLDTAGRFCLFQSGFTHSMVDVVGFFAPTATTPTGALYLPVPPSRVLDTRSQPVCDAFGNCMLGTGVQAGVPTAAAVNAPVHPVAIAATVTAWSPQAVSSVMLDACDQVSARVAPTPLPNVSANPADAATAAWVVARATGREVGGQTCLLGPAGIGATVDVQGVFAAATDGGFPFRATATSRVLDTRKCWTDAASALQKCNVVNAPGAVLHLKAPAGAAAVAVAVSSIGVTGGGTVSVDTCTGIGASGTATAIQSAVPGLITNTMVFAPVGADGTWCLRVGGTMHVVVDQLGWFGTAGTLGYVPVTPVRVHDSRPPA